MVYSTCNLCAKDPTKAPLWQIRALSAVQDLEHKKIEYQDAVMEMYGIPVGYMPYFWHADPSVKRASGLLIPSLGAFVASRRVLRAAVLLGDRRSVGRDIHADDDHARRARSSRSSTGAGSTTATCCSTARSAISTTRCRATIYRQGPVQSERHLALGLQRRARVVIRLRPRLPPRRPARHRPERADQPDLRRRVRAGRLFALRRPVLPEPERHDRQQQAAARSAALRVQLFRPARLAWADASASTPARSM